MSKHRKPPAEATEIHVTPFIKMVFIKEEREDVKMKKHSNMKIRRNKQVGFHSQS